MAVFLTATPHKRIYEFLRDRIKIAWSDDLRVIGKVEDGVLVGASAFNNYTGTSCQMHFAGDCKGWLSRHFIRESFRYAFDVLGCKVVYAHVSDGCQEALGIDLRLGFEKLIYLPDAHPDGGINVLQMRREQCRWLKREDRHGRQE